jgi:protein-tyrosine phosphatase
VEPVFVDCHSHVAPSGDDGAQTLSDALWLCRDAARHGTSILFATPHVFPHLPLTPERERAIRANVGRMRAGARIELRLGFELTPAPELLRDDPWRYRLEGTDHVLMEVPFRGPIDLLVALAERTEAAGLRPVIAHPERTEAVLAEPELALELVDRGWAVQVNASSLLGRHGEDCEALGWALIEAEVASLVASDGHRETRPARLDEAFARVRARFGEAHARPLFDGSALGLTARQLARAS